MIQMTQMVQPLGPSGAILLMYLVLAFWAGLVMGAVMMGILMTRKLNHIMAAMQIGVKIPK